MEPIPDRVWRPSLPARAGAWAFAVAGLVTAAVVVGSLASGDHRGVEGLLFLGGTGLLLAAGAWRCGLHPFLAATASGIQVRNPLRSVLVPWSDVEGVVPGSGGVIILRCGPRPAGEHTTSVSVGLAEGSRHITAWAVQKSRWAHWLGRRVRADDVAHELAQRARHEQRARREQQAFRPTASPTGAGERPAGMPR